MRCVTRLRLMRVIVEMRLPRHKENQVQLINQLISFLIQVALLQVNQGIFMLSFRVLRLLYFVVTQLNMIVKCLSFLQQFELPSLIFVQLVYFWVDRYGVIEYRLHSSSFQVNLVDQLLKVFVVG